MTLTDTSTEHIIVIDDNTQIRSTLVSALLASCAAAGKDAYLIQSMGAGVYTPRKEDNARIRIPDVIVGVADCARNALDLLDPLLVRRATILCDIVTPHDMQVGLFGLLDHLAETQIEVNLIFMSSEAQNLNYVRELVRRRKAFFLDKGTDTWVRMPHALVNNLSAVRYTTIIQPDYDIPFLDAAQPSPNQNHRPPQEPPSPPPAQRQSPTMYMPPPPQAEPHHGFLSRLRALFQSFRLHTAAQ